VSHLTAIRLHTFTEATLAEGNQCPPLVHSSLDRSIANQVMENMHQAFDPDDEKTRMSRVYPFDSDLVTPRVIGIVLEHLKADCGMKYSYVVDNTIVVTNVQTHALPPLTGHVGAQVDRQGAAMPASTVDVDGVGTIALAPLGGQAGREIRHQQASLAGTGT